MNNKPRIFYQIMTTLQKIEAEICISNSEDKTCIHLRIKQASEKRRTYKTFPRLNKVRDKSHLRKLIKCPMKVDAQIFLQIMKHQSSVQCLNYFFEYIYFDSDHFMEAFFFRMYPQLCTVKSVDRLKRICQDFGFSM